MQPQSAHPLHQGLLVLGEVQHAPARGTSAPTCLSSLAAEVHLVSPRSSTATPGVRAELRRLV
jgi:hypothetical protein